MGGPAGLSYETDHSWSDDHVAARNDGDICPERKPLLEIGQVCPVHDRKGSFLTL
jgi:hypothetical protein